MNWIEEVKLKLGWAIDQLELASGGRIYVHIDDATRLAKEALAAIPDEDPMVKLLRLLENWCAGIGEIGQALTDDDKILIGVIRQTIAREFGYKLENE